MRRLWQSTMIGLARPARVKRWIQGTRGASSLATRYVAGETAADGVERAVQLAREGVKSSLFFLGEYVARPELVTENVNAKLEVAALLGDAGLDVHVSVDPTQIGYLVDPNLARRNARRIAEAIFDAAGNRNGVHALMLDMEDESVTDATIAMHDELTHAGLLVALTLQAYLRRTEADLAMQIRRGAKVRLVKGAFAASRGAAFPTQSEIKANSRRLIEAMFSKGAHDAGFYPILATHDDRLQAHAIEQARANGWNQGEYEFEMLLGIRGDVAAKLAHVGERVRLYVPFGRDWWPYAVRRIGENPRNALLLARSILSRH